MEKKKENQPDFEIISTKAVWEIQESTNSVEVPKELLGTISNDDPITTIEQELTITKENPMKAYVSMELNTDQCLEYSFNVDLVKPEDWAKTSASDKKKFVEALLETNVDKVIKFMDLLMIL